jgi:hypothetical protein
MQEDNNSSNKIYWGQVSKPAQVLSSGNAQYKKTKRNTKMLSDYQGLENIVP